MAGLTAFIDIEANLVKVALVKGGEPILFDADVLERPGQLDTIIAARVLRKEGRAYWCDVGLSRPGLLGQEKDFPPLQEGEKVLVQISREAFLDSGEAIFHTQQKPVELTRQIVLAHQGCLYFPLQDQFKGRSAAPLLPLDQQQGYLKALFADIQQRSLQRGVPAVLLHGPTVIERFLKNLPAVTAIHVATPELILPVKSFCHCYRPDLLELLKLRRPGLFFEEGLDEEWQTCLDSIVPFSKGTLVIESTACLTSVDVNASLALAEEANEAALKVIAKQLIWRRLSGNVVIDFMATSQANKKGLSNTLERLLREDRPSWRVFGWSPLGWLELQRAKRRLPLGMVTRLYHTKEGT